MWNLVKYECLEWRKNVLRTRKIKDGKVYTKEILSEESVVQSSKIPLDISINIPNTVLTGTNYDADIVLETPLGNKLLAGGLITITGEQVTNQVSPSIDLKPLGGGGLFKSVKAPLNPGYQTISAIITHPKGIYTITKKFKVSLAR